ncbi:Thymidylate kinase [uncultured archaeon]|nr:Thymidylate kinase [uncultured archaeon]
MLIVFEGIDGSGKNTQIRKLLAFLRQHRVAYKLHKYPTKKAVDAFAHLSGEKNVPAERLAAVFAEDIVSEQAQLEKERAGGFVVICDRYLHSTLAYQAVGIGYEKLKGMLEKKNAAVPDLVMLFDLPAGKGAERKKVQKTPDRHEKDVQFLEKVRQNYLRMGRETFLSYKYAVVDASQGKEEIFSEVITQIEPLIIRKLEK